MSSVFFLFIFWGAFFLATNTDGDMLGVAKSAGDGVLVMCAPPLAKEFYKYLVIKNSHCFFTRGNYIKSIRGCDRGC